MGLQGDRLEIRILSSGGKTIHKDHSDINNEKKLANLFSILKFKFDIDPISLMKKNKDWFNL